MNVRISQTWDIATLVVSEIYDHPVINSYNITAAMTVTSDSSSEYNIAYRRINHWLHGVMADSILISKDHPRLAQWQDLGVRGLVFPEEPVDQLVGIMLWSKLTAIVEQRLHIDEMIIRSQLDDGIAYMHSSDEMLGAFADAGWWNNPRPQWQDRRRGQRSKIINLDRELDWSNLDLGWPPDEDQAQIVFQPDENK